MFNFLRKVIVNQKNIIYSTHYKQKNHETKKRVYLDLEYMYPGMTKELERPTEKERRLIVQIGAILVDEQSEKEIRSLDILTKPIISYKLPEFFIELTDITQEELEKKGDII